MAKTKKPIKTKEPVRLRTKKLAKPILPVEVPPTDKLASPTAKIATADDDIKEVKPVTASDTEEISDNEVDNLEIEKESLNSIKDVIKEISEIKPNSTSEAIRKVYWRPLGPQSLENKKPQNNRRDRRRRRR